MAVEGGEYPASAPVPIMPITIDETWSWYRSAKNLKASAFPWLMYLMRSSSGKFRSEFLSFTLGLDLIRA
jgi:hypothetical protein